MSIRALFLGASAALLIAPAWVGCGESRPAAAVPERLMSPQDESGKAAGALPKANPEMQAVLDELAALGGKPIESLSPEEARKQPTPADAVEKLLNAKGASTRICIPS